MTIHKSFGRYASLGAALALAGAAGAVGNSLAPSPIFFEPTAYLSAADIPAGFYQGGRLDATLAGTGGSVISASFGGIRFGGQR